MNDKFYYVYIMSNKHNTVLYTGITNNLERRVYEHKKHLVDGFTDKYNVERLVYYECANDVICAIEREKQIKSWSRARKDALINSVNPERKDLSAEF